jgi:hypothetical protein
MYLRILLFLMVLSVNHIIYSLSIHYLFIIYSFFFLHLIYNMEETKPKRTLSPEALQKLQLARKKALEAKRQNKEITKFEKEQIRQENNRNNNNMKIICINICIFIRTICINICICIRIICINISTN